MKKTYEKRDIYMYLKTCIENLRKKGYLPVHDITEWLAHL